MAHRVLSARPWDLDSQPVQGAVVFLKVLTLAALLICSHQTEVDAMGSVREPVVAGQFYPADPKALREGVTGYLDQAEVVSMDGAPMALLAPHAGYVYSGQVAGWAYRQIRGLSYNTVVVLSPSHRVPFRGVSVMSKGGYRTPLGLIDLDEGVCKRLLEHRSLVQEIPEAHGPEHALEVQLPFLQVALGQGWRLVPLIIGTQDLQTARGLAEALEPVLMGTKALLVASSDLSHYHPATRAEGMDKAALRYMEKVDPEGLWEEIRGGKVEACGIGPILVALVMAKRAGIEKGTLLKYAHSGDVSGDRSRVVGYAAMAWSAPREATGKKAPAVGVDLGLTDDEKKTLKEIARNTIEYALQGRPQPEPQVTSPTLKEPRGAFVTLEKNNQLRGCIGMIQATKPLYQTVQEMAEAAAFRDPRFPPLGKEELADVEIEISVLTPMREIKDVSEIQVGVHGLYIAKGPHRGLLLPQVATDYGWDRKTFLEHTCMKAGLHAEAWKDPDARIYIFSADIF
ncbi:MAG: AmmeMemoRadiSam system protein B [Thermodesulfobacteriota bacterium]